ncbi:hypothetical protein UFOVP123_24 [uncultured Caudovirales phage]|uniref:Uncharacterized protein n=1 Tax=uncultured Caudovirales phage TaxID=2100421 RepID=A0A6J5LC38_9CAUD|nr:hypothetical protein UFOVP123_24 [uncultured Caudovirales phage]
MAAAEVIDRTEARLNTHEQICALRYENIDLQLKSTIEKVEMQFQGSNARLKRIEQIMIGSSVAVIGGFGSIIMLLLNLMAK